jgi:internalin A
MGSIDILRKDMRNFFGMFSVSVLLFQFLTVATVSAQEANQKSFLEWCEKKESVGASINDRIEELSAKKTIGALLKVAQTKNCKQANSKLKSLDKLTLTNQGIVNLKPLASLPNLTSLDLDKNEIVDLKPLASLTNLKILNLRENQIVNLKPLSSLINLTSLNLEQNQIINLKPLASLTNLTSLDLDKNEIIDPQPLASLTNLISLELDKNEIVNINSLATLTNLKTLNLRENKIADPNPLASLTNIKLFLFDNQTIDGKVVTPQLKPKIVALKDREIGLLFQGKNLPASDEAQDTIFLVGTNFVGRCPAFDAYEGDAKFFSRTMKPADNLRVIIRNITFGFSGNEKPYTDREYYSGDLSEGFNVRFGDSNSNRYLAVKSGENKFEYIIKNRDTVIDTGEFLINFDKKFSTVQRDGYETTTNTCIVYNKNGSCAQYIPERIHKCQ